MYRLRLWELKITYADRLSDSGWLALTLLFHRSHRFSVRQNCLHLNCNLFLVGRIKRFGKFVWSEMVFWVTADLFRIFCISIPVNYCSWFAEYKTLELFLNLQKKDCCCEVLIFYPVTSVVCTSKIVPSSPAAVKLFPFVYFKLYNVLYIPLWT